MLGVEGMQRLEVYWRKISPGFMPRTDVSTHVGIESLKTIETTGKDVSLQCCCGFCSEPLEMWRKG
ncbi:MAG TPA: hypothetical protein PLN47_01700 [Candidatus Atribacteria bacterium]|jgi:hypothetical protein|nr:hypothetical protein [Candidatus Atribacteria bacterium]